MTAAIQFKKGRCTHCGVSSDKLMEIEIFNFLAGKVVDTTLRCRDCAPGTEEKKEEIWGRL